MNRISKVYSFFFNKIFKNHINAIRLNFLFLRPLQRTILIHYLKLYCTSQTVFAVDIYNGYLFYRGNTYSLFTHNCNNFTEEVAQFLVGKSIPQYILDLPKEVLNSNLNPVLLNLLNNLENRSHIGSTSQSAKEGSPDFDDLQSQIEEARLAPNNEKVSGENKKLSN